MVYPDVNVFLFALLYDENSMPEVTWKSSV